MEAQSPKQKYEGEEWKVANGCDENKFGLVLKMPTDLCDYHASDVDLYILTTPVQGDVSLDVSSDTKLKDLIILGLKMHHIC